MEQRNKRDRRPIHQRSFQTQQPLSTFDLDDEIVPSMLIPSSIVNVDTQTNNVDKDVNRPYNLHQAPLEFFTIYEKGDEEKTFHNEEMEQRSNQSTRRNKISYSEYPTHKLGSEVQDTTNGKDINGDICTPEYYEQLLFIKGESPRASTEIKENEDELKLDRDRGELSDDYEDVQVEEVRYENQIVINAVKKSKEDTNDYENVEYVNGQLIQPSTNKSKSYESEGMYAMGRRFPSFRIIKGKKKSSKRNNSQEKSNKSEKQFNNLNINSASKEADAIYSRPKKWKFMSKRSEKETKTEVEKNNQFSESGSILWYNQFTYFLF